MHYYQMNIGDYASHTSHLTPMEDLAFRRLLDYYYLHESPIPNDIELITRKLRLNGRSTDVQQVLNEFFILVENEWINARANDEIRAFKSKKVQATQAGKASGIARIERMFNGRSTDDEPNTKHKPLTINHKLKPPNPLSRINALDDGFVEFWNYYPKKIGKDKALAAWGKKKPKVDIVLNTLKWQKESEEWNKENGQFIPNPATYINQGRWQDEPTGERIPF